MSDFLVKHLDIVYFFYGLSFIFMGTIIFSQLRIIRKSEFKLLGVLWLLAWFGIIHGANEFIDMFIIIHGRGIIFKILSPVFLITSFIFLFCFGYRLINFGKKNVLSVYFGILSAAAFLIAVFLAGITSEAAWINSSRYFLCFPGGLISAIGFFLYYRTNSKQLNKLRAGRYFILAASFLCIYAIIGGLIVRKADFFPASVVNLEAFISLVRIPPQCFRAICALGIAFSVWNILGIFDAEEAEKRKKADELKRLSDIGTLAATIAHELRNPLAAIGMAAHNIKRKSKNSDLDKHLSNIEKKIAESDQIIDNILFYSRIKPPRYENINIFDIIAESIVSVLESRKKDISIIRNIDSLKDIPIEADPTQIEEVINNILNNACDAVPSVDGKVEIISACEDEFIEVAIKDNGQGIDKESVAKVFDPFFTTKAKGTGLGLSVCQQIINLHDGSIHIQSEPGKGTSVTVRLPKKGRNNKNNKAVPAKPR